tara:strand:+ start:2683 stop:3945 length:1263 start_codon:yes stop_codon:yes gene_type:complete
MDAGCKEKITIVGGGIIGCLVAIHFIKKNYDVTIVEQKKNLGGVLRDYEIKNDFFFRGCQYLESDIKWLNDFKIISTEKFNHFKYNYASNNTFNNKTLLKKDLAIPIFKLKNIKKSYFNFHNYKKKSLDDKISFYPKEIKKNLINFVKNCGLNPKEIHYNCAQNLQISRVNIFNSDRDLISLKKEKIIFDQNLAVSRKIRKENNLFYSTPINGYSRMFDSILINLKKMGIKIILNTKVEPIWIKNKLNLEYNKKEISDSLIFWSGNPTKLIYNFNKKKIKSNIFKTFQISANISSNIKKNFFLQNFSDKSKILRIQIYNSKKNCKIGVESVFSNSSGINILNEAKKILLKLNIKIKIFNKTIVKYPLPRFDVYTVSDQKIISDFQNKTKDSNLLYSPWLIYGRKIKIKEIIDSFISKKIQ